MKVFFGYFLITFLSLFSCSLFDIFKGNGNLQTILCNRKRAHSNSILKARAGKQRDHLDKKYNKLDVATVTFSY